MKKHEFIERLGEVLMAEPGKTGEETPLESLPGWDSMGQVATVGFLDEVLGASPPPGSLQQCRTVGDILGLVAGKLED